MTEPDNEGVRVGSGPFGVKTQDDVARESGPGLPTRVCVLDNEVYDKLREAVEAVDGTAVRMVGGGGMDLSGWVIKPRPLAGRMPNFAPNKAPE